MREAGRCGIAEMCVVINDGASACRGVIPVDRWHEPYVPVAELHSEIDAGVQFSCYMEKEEILGVMGVQDRGAVVLIRHAYVRTAARRQGIGTRLPGALILKSGKPILTGTWRTARWAIDFYEKQEFSVLPDHQAQDLLRKYWSVPPRQKETSVVLADHRFVVQAGTPIAEPADLPKSARHQKRPGCSFRRTPIQRYRSFSAAGAAKFG